MLKGGKYDWNFQTVNDSYSSQALIDGSQKQPRGKMLGGSGSLNDMVYARGFPVDYEHWAALSDDNWNWTNVLEYFKKSEHLSDERILEVPALLENHGHDGPIEVSGFIESSYDIDRFLDAFKELGFKMVKDMVSVNEIGAGRFSHTIKQGRRASSLTGMLNEAAARTNLHVLKNATVASVLIANKTAYGVRVFKNKQEFHFHANKEIILSAGTFNTPKILFLSGIGPKEHLQEFNINVVHDLPGVGDNLHDHVMVLNYLAADNGTCYSDEATSSMNVIRYLHDRSGPLALSNSMGAYLSLNRLQPNVPDFAFYPSCMPIKAGFDDACTSMLGLNDDICSKLVALNENHELITVATVLLKPKSRGKVRLRSTDPFDNPLIYSGTFGNPKDLEGFPKAIEWVRAFVNTTYFRSKRARYVEFEIEACDGLEEVEKEVCKARAMAMSAWHAVGTAAMGSVLDARLRVRGVARLRVADASVMPAVVRGNTNAPVVMIAEQAATFIQLDHSR